MSTTEASPFIDETYHADRNINKHYHHQMATYLSKKEDMPYEAVLSLLNKYIQPNNGTYKDRRFQLLEKNKYGDRELKVRTASDFFKTVQENNYHLSPSMVAYKHSDEEQSVNSIGTETFLKLRSLYKTKRQVAKGEGDVWGEKTYDEIQNALKIFNNAQSGAMSSRGTPLTNKSGHTTLTSICRCLTSTVNMSNEKLLSGNRFYNNFEKTLESILVIIQTTDFEALDKVVAKYNMEHATVKQVMDMIERCSSYYWRNPERLDNIREFLTKLRPNELTAVLLIGDLRGIHDTNPQVLRAMFDDFCHMPEIPEGAVAEDYAEPINGDHYTLTVTKYGRKVSPLEINFLSTYHAAIERKWFDFINVFFKTSVPAVGIYEITDMIREAVQTSDTDSSIYTVDRVVDNYTEDSGVSIRLNGVLTYFIRMMSIHQHAQLSKNMNVSNKNLNLLNMKNEYLFGSYVTTLMSKHYFATQLMVEGVMNKEVKMEIKGVHLRSSKVALEIKEFAHKLMREMLDAIHDRRLLDAADLLERVAQLEKNIKADIDNGTWTWLSRSTIKSDEVYTDPERSVYYYHGFWNAVFGPKYGEAPLPPYSAVKVNATLSNKKMVKEWADNCDDIELAKRLTDYVADKGKLSAFYVPSELLPVLGRLPVEVVQGADVRAIIKQNLKSVYAVLETAGIFYLNKKITKLVSDEF